MQPQGPRQTGISSLARGRSRPPPPFLSLSSAYQAIILCLSLCAAQIGRWSRRPLPSGEVAYVIDVDLVASPGNVTLSALLTSTSPSGGPIILSQTPPKTLTLLSWEQCTPRTTGRRVFDAFLFSSELDMLQLHLHELADVVHSFVLVEATHTFQGQPKV